MKTPSRRALLLPSTACLLLAARVGWSQSAAPARPIAGAAAEAERVARDAFAALEEGRYREVATLVHPAAVAGFRALKLDAARSSERFRTERPAARASSMPPAVAEWFEAQRRRHEAEHGHPSMLASEFVGVASIAELEALDGVEMLARWLEARDPRTHYRRALERVGRGGLADSADASLRHGRTVIGAVPETDSTVAVVYRAAPFGGPPDPRAERTALVTLRRAGDTWRLWSTWRDAALFDEFQGWGVWVESDEETEKRYRDAAATVVTWPPASGARAAGRAYVDGYPGGKQPPRALVVEGRDARGRPVRVEVPVAAFGALAELLHTWPTPPQER